MPQNSWFTVGLSTSRQPAKEQYIRKQSGNSFISLTLNCFSFGDLLQAFSHVGCSQRYGGWDVDQREGAWGRILCWNTKSERQASWRSSHMLLCLLWCEVLEPLPSLSSAALSEEPDFTGRVSPASKDLSCTRSGFSVDSPLRERKKTQGNSRQISYGLLWAHI